MSSHWLHLALAENWLPFAQCQHVPGPRVLPGHSQQDALFLLCSSGGSDIPWAVWLGQAVALGAQPCCAIFSGELVLSLGESRGRRQPQESPVAIVP